MRQQCISTSLSFASERTAEWCTHQQPLLNRGWGLRGGSGPCLLFLPAHFGPAAKRERQRGESEAGKEIMKSQSRCARDRTRDMKSTWNLHGSTFEGSLPAKNHRVGPATRRGSGHMNCRLYVISLGCGIRGCGWGKGTETGRGVRSARESEVNTYMVFFLKQSH